MTGLLMTSLFKRLYQRTLHFPERYEYHDLHYDLSKDVTVTTYKKVMIIGINLPEASNALDDVALSKLNEKLINFNTNDQYTVAVLHGIGGNFCTGIQENSNKENAREIIKTMNNLKKPTIATLTGFTTFFGFQLAIMCDFRVMEMGSFCGFGHGKIKDEIYPEVCKRLLALTNLTTTLDFVLTGSALDNSTALSLGLVNRCVECGTGLGKSITMASSIAKFSLESVIKQRDFVYSLMSTNRFSPK